MKLKLACADFTFPLLSADKVLDLIALLGIEGIDIGLFEGSSHFPPARELKNVQKTAGALAKKAADRGLKIADIYLIVGGTFTEGALNNPGAAARRRLRDTYSKALEYAVVAGSRHLSILPGVYFSEEPKNKSLARCREELAWRIEQTKNSGVVLGVEPHIGSIVPTPAQTTKLLRATPGLTLTLDYCHFTRTGTPDSAIEPLVPYASHFHVRGARKGRLQTSFKENSIDYARVLQVMAESGYKGYLGLEYVAIDWEKCNVNDNLGETIRFRDFLRQAAREPKAATP